MRNLRIFLPFLIFGLAVLGSCKDPEQVIKPVADFTISNKTPKPNQEVQFTSTSKDADAYLWSFGDGATSTDENPTHSYTAEGTFEVTLTVTRTENGETATKLDRIVVSENGSEPPVPGTTIEHSSDITADVTWSKNQIHIISGSVEIINATLTIEPGTYVKFNEDASLIFGYSSSSSHSKLIAKGEKGNEITFTANKANPEAPTWRYIYFGKTASHESIMEYCNISYGGTYSSYSGSVAINNTNIIFNNNTVKHSGSAGIFCDDGGYFGSFTGNTISDNAGSSVKIQAKYAHTLGSGNSIANTKDGIEVRDDINLKGDFTWLNHGAKYTITNSINIGSENGTSLTINKGITVAIKENYELEIGYDDNKGGKLTAVGTADAPIRFVSAKANSSAGDWDCILFGKFNDPTSKMEYCEIDAGGDYSSYYGAIILTDTKIAFDNNKITNSNSAGIHLNEKSSFVSFTGNTINNSAGSSIVIPAQWAHTIGTNNNIANDKYGIAVYDDFNHQNKSFTWLKQTCPYTITNSVEIGSTQGCTLTIEPGTTIQITEDYELEVGYSNNKSGKLIAKGTSSNKITFTSASPTGTWDLLTFGQGTMSGTILDYCTINNGGDYSSDYGAIHCAANMGGTPTVSNCHISNSQSHGISVKKNATPVLENNTFENITGSDIYYWD